MPLPGAKDGYRVECDDCLKSPRPWRDGRAALIYQGKARSLVLALKHGDRPELARPAARWMFQAGRELFCQNMLVAPVPLHWTRLLKRRYNQSALLAQQLARESGMDWCPDLLVRTERTPVLDGKTAAERAQVMSGSVSVNQRWAERLQKRKVLLVDDVMTSGSTLSACASACVSSGANHIFVLVLARVAKDA